MDELPRILWFKARMPGVVNDGSSLVSTNLAKTVAERYHIDLITLRLRGTEDELAQVADGPFRQTFVVSPDNRGNLLKRAFYRAWYELKSRFSGIPRAAYYETGTLVRRQIADLLAQHQYALAVIEYFSAGPLLEQLSMPTLLLLHDASFAEYELRASQATNPAERRRLSRAAEKMIEYESGIAALADAVAVLSRWDLQQFEEAGISNGHHLPVLLPPMPSAPTSLPAGPIVLFVGSLDYLPNADAVTWFVEEILPTVRARNPETVFRVVGGGGNEATRARLDQPGVDCCQWVDDLSDEYSRACVVVAPSRLGTGVKIKVLDAMWHRVPVVCTTLAGRGTPAELGGARLADTPEEFAQAVSLLLQDSQQREQLVQRATEGMEQGHCGNASRERVFRLLEGLAN